MADENLGPLIATDMTRCIHCTRCVRFGEEIAGVKELGATGRGEDMRIGTYVGRMMTSELSGNVIDLCPVGALTNKPARYTFRPWELIQHPAVSPHDSVGSNLFLHERRGRIMRVVPRENERINETWIADRDRYSVHGLYSEDRVVRPLVKRNGIWEEADWDVALGAARDALRGVIDRHGPEQLAGLVSPYATLEEQYLAQKLVRGLGSPHVDHRLRQVDFSDQAHAPVMPWLGQSIEQVGSLDAALLIGSNTRKDQPIVNHRLRKAALERGAVALEGDLAGAQGRAERAAALSEPFLDEARRYNEQLDRELGVDVPGPEPAVGVQSSDIVKQQYVVTLYCPTPRAGELEYRLTAELLEAVQAGSFGVAAADGAVTARFAAGARVALA